MIQPQDPIAAVTHSDPYPYYADLVAHRPVYRDEGLGLWVVSSADAVTAALTSELCRVRPAAEPVPRVLLGSPAAEIFRRLVRMNDGPEQRAFKPVLAHTLGAVGGDLAAEQSRHWVRVLMADVPLKDFPFHLPVYVVGSLLGIPPKVLPQTAQWTRDFVWCVAPMSSPEQIERGKVAAGHLLDLFRSLPARPEAGSGGGLLSRLADAATLAGQGDKERILANGIGLLFQAYEATAGLVGNALLALNAYRDVRAAVTSDPSLLRAVVQEVLRYDSPIQNTRRFLARSGTVAGHEMKEGDGILVVLAAANRDPRANPDPDRFEIRRHDRRLFTFGVGAHACPGEALATTIAVTGVGQVLSTGVDLERFTATVTYRPSANARVPLLGGARA